MCARDSRSEQRCKVIVLNKKTDHDEGDDSIHKAFHATSTLSSACGSQWALTRPKAIFVFPQGQDLRQEGHHIHHWSEGPGKQLARLRKWWQARPESSIAWDSCSSASFRRVFPRRPHKESMTWEKSMSKKVMFQSCLPFIRHREGWYGGGLMYQTFRNELRPNLEFMHAMVEDVLDLVSSGRMLLTSHVLTRT